MAYTFSDRVYGSVPKDPFEPQVGIRSIVRDYGCDHLR